MTHIWLLISALLSKKLGKVNVQKLRMNYNTFQNCKWLYHQIRSFFYFGELHASGTLWKVFTYPGSGFVFFIFDLCWVLGYLFYNESFEKSDSEGNKVIYDSFALFSPKISALGETDVEHQCHNLLIIVFPEVLDQLVKVWPCHNILI